MAINASFNGATIYKPGGYSKLNIDQGGAFPLGQTGLVGIFGEASRGKHGSEELDIATNVYTADQMVEIKNKYGSGPIVDACSMLFAPASDGAIPSGAQAVYIYKTNHSVRASLDVATDYGKVRAKEYGVGGNRISFKNIITPETAAKAESSATFDLTAITFASGDTFSIRIDGSKLYTFTFPVNTIANKTDLVTELLTPGNWSDPAIITAEKFEIRDGNPTGNPATQVKIIVTLDDENSVVPVATHALGVSRTLELIDGINTPLAKVNLAAGFYKPTAEATAFIQINQKRDTLVEFDTVGGNVILEAGCNKSLTSASIVIDATKIHMKENGTDVAVFVKESYKTVKDLAEDMALIPGWTVAIADPLFEQINPAALDHVTARALSATNKPARIKKDAFDVQSLFADSSLCDLVDIDGTTPLKTFGLPDNTIETLLSGGALGATLAADIVNALAIFEGIKLNSIVPLFSRDATDDIADSLTDSNSTYTIDAIHQAVKSHLSLTATTKNKSERQGYLSYKKSFNDCLVKSSQLADFRIQLFVQDTKNVDSDGVIKWYQPWSLACLVAGARAGSPVGTPMTFKYMNCSGVRHTAQPMSTDEQDIVVDFNPRTQYEKAIKGGITFLENPQTGGFRVVVDNTTYGKDGNWVRNRGSTQYAADVLVYDFRNQVENTYTGVKNLIQPNEVKSTCESILATYLAQGITVSSDDAPNGFKSLVVQLAGNIIKISFIAKLVEGIDFVFADITVSRKTGQA